MASAVVSLVLLTTAANATSSGIIRPHDASKACVAIEAAVAEMTGRSAGSDLWPLYYNDEFGHVEYGERPAFIRSMTNSEGKPDKAPVAITMVWPVGKRKPKGARALYIVGLQRDRWFPERQGTFDPMQIEPAGYEMDTSYWLAVFVGDRLLEFREGRYYFDLLEYEKRLKGCGRG